MFKINTKKNFFAKIVIPVFSFALVAVFAISALNSGFFAKKVRADSAASVAGCASAPVVNGQIQCFAFSVNTALGSGGATFSVPTWTSTAYPYAWTIDWGDGTTTTASGNSANSNAATNSQLSHTYATAGTYQVAIRPTATSPAIGWFNAFGAYYSSSIYNETNSATNASATGNLAKVVSLDTPIPNFSRNNSTYNMTNRFAGMFDWMTNIQTIPADIFSEISVDSSNTTNVRGMFYGTFANWTTNTTATIPEGLFDTINTSGIAGTNTTSFYSMFNATFANWNANVNGSIPANLFAKISTANAVDTQYMFYSTFQNWTVNSTVVIPANFFANISTATVSVANMNSMFSGVFKGSFVRVVRFHDSTGAVFQTQTFSGLYNVVDTSTGKSPAATPSASGTLIAVQYSPNNQNPEHIYTSPDDSQIVPRTIQSQTWAPTAANGQVFNGNWYTSSTEQDSSTLFNLPQNRWNMTFFANNSLTITSGDDPTLGNLDLYAGYGWQVDFTEPVFSGGSATPQQVVDDGATATQPTDPDAGAPYGCTFAGWYTKSGTVPNITFAKYNFSTPVGANLTLYSDYDCPVNFAKNLPDNGDANNMPKTLNMSTLEVERTLLNAQTAGATNFDIYNAKTDIKIPASVPTSVNGKYVFQTWNLKTDGSFSDIVNGIAGQNICPTGVINFMPGQQITFCDFLEIIYNYVYNSGNTLYAQWTPAPEQIPAPLSPSPLTPPNTPAAPSTGARFANFVKNYAPLAAVIIFLAVAAIVAKKFREKHGKIVNKI